MRSNLVVLIIAITSFVDSFAAAPVGRYTVTGDAVKDNKTSRVWRRTVSDQPLSFDDANNYCSTLDKNVVWRLPTKRELETLVDVRTSAPAIDLTAFPSTPLHTFWTSTKNNLRENEDRFIVDFANGQIITNLTQFDQPEKALNKHYVRCVR